MEDAEELFSEACDAWDDGNLKKAFVLFRKSANLGNTGAQVNLGNFYDESLAGPRDRAKALYWYKVAAKQRDWAACNNLGIVYRNEGNIRRAKFWFERGLSYGDAEAALNLAKLYLMTGKTRTRITKAKKLLRFLLDADPTYITETGREEAEELLSYLEECES